MPNNLHLIIKERDRGTVYEGDIDLLSAINTTGPFVVMRDHAQFISLIERSVKITHLDGRIQEMPVQNAILKVLKNTVYIYVGIKKN